MGGSGQEIEKVLEVKEAEEELDEFRVIRKLEEEQVLLHSLGKVGDQT